MKAMIVIIGLVFAVAMAVLGILATARIQPELANADGIGAIFSPSLGFFALILLLVVAAFLLVGVVVWAWSTAQH